MNNEYDTYLKQKSLKLNIRVLRTAFLEIYKENANNYILLQKV